MNNDSKPARLLRVRDVIGRVPVSRSTWWRWVRTGYAPVPVRVGENTTAWLESDIDEFIAKLAAKGAA